MISVERKKCEKVIFRGGENPSKMTISWSKKHFLKTEPFSPPLNLLQNQKKIEALF